jgi:hypothetical protein
MFAWFNRGICSAFESAAVAELETRLERLERERAQLLRVVDEADAHSMTLWVYRGDRLIGHAWWPNSLAWVYDVEEDATGGAEHRLRGLLTGWPLLSAQPIDDDAVEPFCSQTQVQFGRRGLSCLLTPAELAVALRGLLRAAETRCAPDARQGNADVVRQLAAGLRVQLK